MNIKLYRGARQIGGCIVGIATPRVRVLIDMGSVLPDTKGNLPEERLSIDEPYDAVIFTHYHTDHIGLMEYIGENIPLYIGEGAREIFSLIKAQEESPLTGRIAKMRTYRDGESFMVGDLKITPILTDHSAFDAYMLLLEAGGKAVLHTGDFRAHGIKGNMVMPRLSALCGKVDVMITEGTNLSYENPVTRPELDLARAAETLMDRYPYTFVMCSPADFDRLAVFHWAARGKDAFYCDTYQMKLLETARTYGAPLSPLYGFERAKVYLEGLESSRAGFCMAVRRGKAFETIMKQYGGAHKEKCLFIYAMSEGHLKKNRSSIEKMTGGFRYAVKLHTSGHCSGEAVWQAVSLVKPGKVIPIHTEQPENFRLGAYQNRLLFLEDGESYDIL